MENKKIEKEEQLEKQSIELAENIHNLIKDFINSKKGMDESEFRGTVHGASFAMSSAFTQFIAWACESDLDAANEYIDAFKAETFDYMIEKKEENNE